MKYLERAPYKVRVRYTLMLACVIAVCMASIALTYWGIQNIKQNSLENTKNIADLIGRANNVALEFDNVEFSQDNLAILKDTPQIMAACIYDKRGKLFASYHQPKGTRDCPTHDKSNARRYSEDATFYRDYLYVSKNIFGIPNDFSVELHGKIAIYSSLKEVHEYLYNQIIASLVIASLALIVSYLLTQKLGEFISAPVLSIAKLARDISLATDYSYRAQNPYSNELGHIIDSFNKILSHREEVHQQFKNKSKDYVKAYKNTNEMIKLVQKEFVTPYYALATFSQMLEQKPLGINLNHYADYFSDLETDMENYKNCIDSTLSLIELYEKSLIQEREHICITSIFDLMLSRLPDLRCRVLDNTDRKIRDIFVSVYKEAFERAFKLFQGFLEMVLYSGHMQTTLNLTINQTNGSLFLEFLVASPKPFRLEVDGLQSKSLHSLISDIKQGCLATDDIEATPCHPSTSVLLSNANISSEEYTYLVNSLKYIGNVNNIFVVDELRYDSLIITFDMSHTLVEYSPSLQKVS